MITSGLYRLKSSANSDNPIIKRIIGADKTKLDAWLTMDGESIPTYILEEEYDRFDGAANASMLKSDTKKINEKRKIFSDFEPVEAPTGKVQESPQEKIQPVQKNTTEQKQIIQKPIQEQIPMFVNVLEKLRITGNFNERPSISVSLPIKFDYDIDKVKLSIDLLSLNVNQVTDYLMEKTQTNTNDILRNQISEYLKGNYNPAKKFNFIDRIELEHLSEDLMQHFKNEDVVKFCERLNYLLGLGADEAYFKKSDAVEIINPEDLSDEKLLDKMLSKFGPEYMLKFSERINEIIKKDFLDSIEDSKPKENIITEVTKENMDSFVEEGINEVDNFLEKTKSTLNNYLTN